MNCQTGYVRLSDLDKKERRRLNKIVRRQKKMRPQAPCKDCFDRKFLCHCSCKKYKAFKEEIEKQAEAKRIENEGTPVLCRKVVKQIWREYKK